MWYKHTSVIKDRADGKKRGQTQRHMHKCEETVKQKKKLPAFSDMSPGKAEKNLSQRTSDTTTCKNPCNMNLQSFKEMLGTMDWLHKI